MTQIMSHRLVDERKRSVRLLDLSFSHSAKNSTQRGHQEVIKATI